MSVILDAIKAGGSGRIDIPATRNDLAWAFDELNFRQGAEIGVEAGLYSERILLANPKMRLWCVDRWAEVEGYRDHVKQEQWDDILAACEKRLSQFHERVELCRWESAYAAQTFASAGRILDLVYIDAGHDLASVIADLHSWVPLVRKGGIVAGHDFGRNGNVKEAVEAWVSAYNVPCYYVLTGDRSPSWFWVVA